MAGAGHILSALDKAKTQWYHFTTIVIAGMGFFTDAYDLFCISTVTRLLGRLYYFDPLEKKTGVLPPDVSSAVNGVALCGTLVGQLVFGWMGDKLGRKKVYGWTLVMMILTSLASAMSFGHSAKAVMSSLCFFRFWLGVGIGGDHPLSATIMSEYANQKTRGAFIAAVFAMQGMGILGGATMSIILSSAFRNALPDPAFMVDPIASTPPQADYVWRIVLAFGALPAALTFYYRMKMPETARYTALVAKNNKQAALDMGRVLQVDFTDVVDVAIPFMPGEGEFGQSDYGLLSRQFMQRHGVQLLGCTSTWLLLDNAFYFSEPVPERHFLVHRLATTWEEDERSGGGFQGVSCPSFDRVGFDCSRPLGDGGVSGCHRPLGHSNDRLLLHDVVHVHFDIPVLRPAWKPVSIRPFPVLRRKSHSVSHFICSHFLLCQLQTQRDDLHYPSRAFPCKARSTCHGISAAAGKAGAIVGAFGFLYAAQSQVEGKQDKGYTTGIGLRNSFLLLSIINAAGFLCTFLVPETKGRSLEDLSGENEAVDIRRQAAPQDNTPSFSRVKVSCNF